MTVTPRNPAPTGRVSAVGSPTVTGSVGKNR
jgi:hypothetical protein